MNRRYDELNRELRMLMAIEGTYTTLSILTHLPNFVSHMISSETFEIFTSLDGMSMEFFFFNFSKQTKMGSVNPKMFTIGK